MRLLRFLVALFICLLIAVSWAEPQVRVLLGEVSGTLTIQLQGGHRGYIDGVLRFETPLGLSWSFSAQGGMLWASEQQLGQQLRLEPTSSELLSWRGHAYRGSLMLRAKGNLIQVINVVGLESYLRGVVPAEMQASWPLEALKAQAVAARSYTLYSLDPERPYDICATVDCQVYGGVSSEHPNADRAIAATRGLVLTYGGNIAQTYYHADSGGFMASSAEVWGKGLPYLQAHADVAVSSPHRHWERHLDPQVMTASLAAYGINLEQVRALRVLTYSESGRVDKMEVLAANGSVVLKGETLQSLLRAWGLKSTRFEMRGALMASGDGWGHGVGMSQYGARSLARSGYPFERILQFYYPGTQMGALPYRFDALGEH